MFIHFSYNLSVLVIGNTSVNGYKIYSSTFTDSIIIPAAYYIALRTDSTAPTASAWASTAPTASACASAARPNKIL